MEQSEAWRLTDELHALPGKGDPFAAAVRGTRMAMIITDPRRADNPIVYANNAFLKMTGYSREEVIGRNCRFLQGPDTDSWAVQQIRDAIKSGRDIGIDVLNYRKDGTAFWNALYLSPVVNEEDETLYYFASQLDATHRVDVLLKTQQEKDFFENEVAKRTRDLRDALAAQTMLVHEVDHRVKNNLQMVASLLTMQIKAINDPVARAAMEDMLTRVDALGTVHRRLYQSSNVERFEVTEFTRDLATDLVRGSGRDNIRLHFDIEEVEVPVAKATPVALMMNEIITNALKHAFPERRAGRLSITIAPDGNYFSIKIADDGVGMPDELASKKSFGKRLIENLARQLNANIGWQPADPGTTVNIRLPRELAVSSEPT